ncbi:MULTISPECIES: hypothetical protein [Nocardioides]|uniref:Integral membrane protein n=1 Tax=Nocardioides vastitatis TaxID=2568655 RepID=A0ABW0ZE40_9ACTN|nr:hypothetical protein [Nocardioides sp.]THJ08314.1 hypothetical protein E7Z54_04650 [Nocardioides sp.]
MTATTATPATTSTGRVWFAADAAVAGANAAAYLLVGTQLADLLGGSADTYRWAGGFLVAFALGVAVYARSTMPAAAGWAIVVANVLWVIGSLEVAATGALGLDGPGRGWVLAQAVVVGVFAVLQGRSLRRR